MTHRLQLHLPEDVYEALCLLARAEQRTPAGQGTWLLLQALRTLGSDPTSQPTPPVSDFLRTPPSGAEFTPSTPMVRGWIPIRHTRGRVPCGETAMYAIRKLDPGDYRDTSLEALRLVDGTTPTPTTVPLCGGCGQVIDPYTTEDLDWGPAFVRPPHPQDATRLQKIFAEERMRAAYAQTQTQPWPPPDATSRRPPTEPVLQETLARLALNLSDPSPLPSALPSLLDE